MMSLFPIVTHPCYRFAHDGTYRKNASCTSMECEWKAGCGGATQWWCFRRAQPANYFRYALTFRAGMRLAVAKGAQPGVAVLLEPGKQALRVAAIDGFPVDF